MSYLEGRSDAARKSESHVPYILGFLAGWLTLWLLQLWEVL